ncbi:MAG: long-chain fatty acid--CoA ligase [Bacteroidetes bacterium QS_4_64_154]|nr:MAG: long-chain fatty acid--CoA ligase [Bacteroidetes bacterium QS_4_64_154]
MPAQVEFDTIPQLFRRLCKRYRGQERPVLRYKDRGEGWHDIVWEDLEDRVQALAGYLHRQGVRKGDRVALLSENRPEWKVCIVSVPVQRKKVEEIADECPKLEEVIVMSETADDPPVPMTHWDDALEDGRAYWTEHEDELVDIAEGMAPDDMSALIYTSGTTGKPKGVVLTNRNFCSNVKAALQRVPFGEDDHHLSFLPLSHAFERTAGHTAVLAAGATISYAESIEAVSQNLVEVQPTLMISVPRMFEKVYNRVTKQASEGSVIQQKVFEWAVRVGERYAEAQQSNGTGPGLGAALPKEIGTFFQAAGVTIIEGYGLTETAPVLTVNPMDAPRYGTVGHILPGVTVAIQPLDGDELAGTVSGSDYPTSLSTPEGEILVKGPNVMREYWNRPEKTRAAFDEEGWYHSGDVGRFEDGYLKITDRIKHMIVTEGGKNVYPGPIEETFKTEGWIDQIVVIGEGRPFLVALVVPDFDSLRMRARDEGIDHSDYTDAELLELDAIQRIFQDAFTAYNREAAAHEKIRNFRLLAELFTVEEGTLTPTLKLRRSVIEERHEDLIDAMYEEFGQ